MTVPVVQLCKIQTSYRQHSKQWETYDCGGALGLSSSWLKGLVESILQELYFNFLSFTLLSLSVHVRECVCVHEWVEALHLYSVTAILLQWCVNTEQNVEEELLYESKRGSEVDTERGRDGQGNIQRQNSNKERKRCCLSFNQNLKFQLLWVEYGIRTWQWTSPANNYLWCIRYLSK